MSGHNKWSKIKHKKGAEDAKKSKVFSMLARTIAIESKAAKGDANSPRVRAVVEKARKSNMPKENIERAIAKGAGTGGEAYEAVRYEGYGPGGVALIVEGITDNPNRTSQEIKHIFTKRGYALGTPGSAAWAFEHKEVEGSISWVPNSTIPLSDEDGEKLGVLVDELDEHNDIENVFTNAS
ncbi:MAG TPA: YebC/PmpR family DNA-binding transcriptional regulator [Candidatus Paceibacterota bacterium]